MDVGGSHMPPHPREAPHAQPLREGDARRHHPHGPCGLCRRPGMRCNGEEVGLEVVAARVRFHPEPPEWTTRDAGLQIFLLSRLKIKGIMSFYPTLSISFVTCEGIATTSQLRALCLQFILHLPGSHFLLHNPHLACCLDSCRTLNKQHMVLPLFFL
jgi:hypothetical protein